MNVRELMVFFKLIDSRHDSQSLWRPSSDEVRVGNYYVNPILSHPMVSPSYAGSLRYFLACSPV